MTGNATEKERGTEIGKEIERGTGTGKGSKTGTESEGNAAEAQPKEDTEEIQNDPANIEVPHVIVDDLPLFGTAIVPVSGSGLG